MRKDLVIKLLSVFVVLIIILIIGISYFNKNIKVKQKNDSNSAVVEIIYNNKKDTNKKKVEKKEEKVNETSIEDDYQPVEVINPSTAPVTNNHISIPGVLDDYLMKDQTGEHFYLSHDIYGNYDGRGVPYVDFRNDFTGRKTIIYAHSSTTGNGPFQALQNYHNNAGYYSSHPTITINYEGNTYTYQIFSVYVSVADNEQSEGLEYFHYMDYYDDDWQEALNRYKSHSEYETGVSVNSNDRILILQTCSMDPAYYEKYYRYNLLIMGKLI